MIAKITTNKVFNWKNYIEAKRLIALVGGTKKQRTLNGKNISDKEYNNLFYFDNTPTSKFQGVLHEPLGKAQKLIR